MYFYPYHKDCKETIKNREWGRLGINFTKNMSAFRAIKLRMTEGVGLYIF